MERRILPLIRFKMRSFSTITDPRKKLTYIIAGAPHEVNLANLDSVSFTDFHSGTKMKLEI